MTTNFKTSRVPGALVIIAATIIAYIPAMRGGFIWDDPDYVVNNDNLRSFDGLFRIWFVPKSSPQYYPLVHTSFWIEYHLWGLNPIGYHVVNVLLHTASALLLWKLLEMLNIPGAWLAAAIFALHPVHVESVAWITERKNVLSGLFYFASAIAYFSFSPPLAGGAGGGEHPEYRKVPLPQREGRIRLYTISLALFVCALLSKTVTATLPAAILVILWWKRGRITRSDIVSLIPFLVLGIAMGLITAYLEQTHVGATGERVAELNLSIAQRVLIAGRVIAFYLGTLFWPHPLVFIYPRWDIDPHVWWQWSFPIAVVVVMLTLWLNRKRWGRAPLAAALIFCGTLLPVLGFFNVYPMRFSYVADHFQYLASVPVIVLVATILWRAGKHWSAIVLVPLAIVTFNRGFAYANAETLWRDTLAKNKQSWMVYTNLGHALRDRGDYVGAFDQYEAALRLAPNIHDTHTNVGSMLGFWGRDAEAVAHLNEALKVNPSFAPAHYHLALIYKHQGRIVEAERALRAALQSNSQYPLANFELGKILEQRGDDEHAIDHYRVAVTYQPDFPEARFNLGNALIRKRAFDEAMFNLMEAVRVKPDYAEAWTSLGGAQLVTGHPQDAANSFRRALQINPNIIPAQRGLDAAMQKLGR